MADAPPPPPPIPPFPPPPPPQADLKGKFQKPFHVHGGYLLDDLKVLQTHLMLPFREIFKWTWTQDKKLVSIMLLGLFPMAAETLFDSDARIVYWCFGLYFSMLWALFFFRFFQPEGVTRYYSATAFWGTGIVSMTVLVGALHLGLESLRDPLLNSSSMLVQAAGNIFLVGVPEEMCKAAVILYLLFFRGPKVPSVPMIVFYGLMSGLGFGIYEGMQYQMGKNFESVENADNADMGAASYYFNNMIRLTTLPFIHAMWTAIGAYFWALGRLYPRRRYGLWASALAIPALLHGLHDTWSDSLPYLSLLIDVLSVYILMVYLSESQKIEQMLQAEGVVEPRPTVAGAVKLPPIPSKIPPVPPIPPAAAKG